MSRLIVTKEEPYRIKRDADVYRVWFYGDSEVVIGGNILRVNAGQVIDFPIVAMRYSDVCVREGEIVVEKTLLPPAERDFQLKTSREIIVDGPEVKQLLIIANGMAAIQYHYEE